MTTETITASQIEQGMKIRHPSYYGYVYRVHQDANSVTVTSPQGAYYYFKHETEVQVVK